MFQKILVAIDRSQMSQQVFDEALSLAKATGAGLMLLHVLTPFYEEDHLGPVFPGLDGTYPVLYSEAVKSYMQQWETLEQEELLWLKSLANKASNIGVSAQFSQNLGDPGRMICELARSWQADLIMMGRRGRTGLSELFLGSVSNYVLHHAPCSVLTVQQRANSSQKADMTAQVAEPMQK